MANKVYTLRLSHSTVGPALVTSEWLLYSQNRTQKIKSITYDLRLSDSTAAPVVPLPLEINEFATCIIQFGNAMLSISKNIQYVLGVIGTSGDYFEISRPCHLQFDSFFVNPDGLPILITMNNAVAAQGITFDVNLIIEVEEEIIYM